MKKNNKGKYVAAILLSSSLGLTNVMPAFAQDVDSEAIIEESENNTSSTNQESTEDNLDEISTEENKESSDREESEVQTNNNSSDLEQINVNEEENEEVNNENNKEENEIVSTDSIDSFPLLTGQHETVENGYKLSNVGGNNINISSVQGKTFSFSSDITFDSGENKTSLIFGAENNTENVGNFFGLEVWLNGTQVQFKLFQDPASIIYFDGPTVEVGDTKTVHLEVSVNDDNQLSVSANGTAAQLNMNQDFSNAYNGGYFGILTWNSEATWSNIEISAEPIPQSNFNTNLTNLHGRNGTWRENEEGLYSSGTGDNFAISDTIVKNFEYSANIRNVDKKGAGSLVFRSEENPSDGSLIMNVDYSNNVFKLFSFGSGSGTYETVSLANVPEKEDGSYDLKVQMYENHLRVYVNNVGIINRDIDFRPNEGRLGLLTWDGTVIYQNVTWARLDSWDDIETPHLTGITVPEGVTITPSFDESVSVYGMDIQPEVDEAVIGVEAPEGSKLYVTKSDENGKIIKEKTEITDGTFTISSDEFFEDFMNVDITIESEGFSNIVNFAVNKWTSTEDLANEEYRSQFHITPQSNFMNDPNGLVYDPTDGYWHAYYQYSTKNNFNNQSWAHVRSKDLVNWEQMPLAIQIDDDGLIFSGCGIEDPENKSGLFDGTDYGYGKDSRLIVYYTYSGPAGQSQAYAYSTDHGVTWKKGGIILDSSHSLDGDRNNFRDPKVFQVPGDDEHYYMVTAGGAAQIFTSTNLIDWEFSQALTYKDGAQIYSECPMMYEATIEGTNEKKWIYGGSAGFYVVGNMEKDPDTGIYKWTAESEKLNVESNSDPWGGFGKYATMTFWEDPTDANRVIGISWLQDTKDFSGKDYKGVQSLPQEYGLKRVNGQYVITCYPVEEVNSLRDTENMLYEENEPKTVTPSDGNILQGVSGITYDIEAVFDLTDTTASEFGFKLRKGNGQEMVYKYDVDQQKMVLDVSKSDSCQNGGIWQQTLVPMEGNKIQLRIIIDQGAVESFGNYGEANISTVAYMSKNNIGMEFFTDGDIKIDSLNIYDMKSMYSGESGSETAEQQLYLDAPSFAETGKEFTVNANVYPNKGNSGVAWSYSEGLEVVNEGTTSTTIKASKEGTYTIKASIGGLEKEVNVRVADLNFENNADGWETISGNWTVTDEGAIGNNASSGDSFYLSNATVRKDEEFTLEVDMTLVEGQAAGIVFGVTDKQNPTSNWYCANIDTKDNIAKLFFNQNGEKWAVSKSLDELTKARSTSYKLSVHYDGQGTMSYSVNGVEVGTKDGVSFEGGYVGIQTFNSYAIFNNLKIDTPNAAVDSVIGSVENVQLDIGSTQDDLLASLPQTIQVKLDNSTFVDKKVNWDLSQVDLNNAGTYEATGTVDGYATPIKVQITVSEKAPVIDSSKLESLIEAIEKEDLSKYTETTVKALQDKIAEAKALLGNGQLTQSDIDSMIQSIQNLYDALEETTSTTPENPDEEKPSEEDPNQPANPDQKPSDNTDKPSNEDENDQKTEGTKTSVALGTGLFGMLAGVSAFGAGVLSMIRRKKH